MIRILKPACVALHNFLRTEEISAPNGGTYFLAGFADNGDDQNGLWRQEEASLALRILTRLSSNMHSFAAKEMRDTYADYFINEGAVEWQRRSVGLDQ
jgi:hypothetical protein